MSDTTLLPEVIEVPDHLQGDTFAGLRFTITQNGIARDLTGADITMTFLLLNRRTTETQVLTIGSGLTLVDGLTAIFDWDEFDCFWTAGAYSFDCQIVYSDGLVKTPFKGIWNIILDKTNNS